MTLHHEELTGEMGQGVLKLALVQAEMKRQMVEGPAATIRVPAKGGFIMVLVRNAIVRVWWITGGTSEAMEECAGRLTAAFEQECLGVDHATLPGVRLPAIAIEAASMSEEAFQRNVGDASIVKSVLMDAPLLAKIIALHDVQTAKASGMPSALIETPKGALLIVFPEPSTGYLLRDGTPKGRQNVAAMILRKHGIGVRVDPGEN